MQEFATLDNFAEKMLQQAARAARYHFGVYSVVLRDAGVLEKLQVMWSDFENCVISESSHSGFRWALVDGDNWKRI